MAPQISQHATRLLVVLIIGGAIWALLDYIVASYGRPYAYTVAAVILLLLFWGMRSARK
jgi:hypothetical protein